jgi:tetratricopeptide (TPR) repeat protein
MSNKTANTLFILSPYATEYTGLYQELLSGVATYQQLGNRLIRLAEQAHAFCQFDKVKVLGQLLSNIPIKHYQAIGYYFLAVAANSKGNGDQDKARKLYETAAETAPMLYRAKAILSLGAVSFNKGKFDSALYYFKEALKVSGFNIASLETIRGMAVLKAVDGSHDHAIKDLESVLPIIKHVPPHTYFDFLNSYAVELGEVGRNNEAEDVSRLTIASPFAPYYPEWQSTYSEIRSSRKRPRYVQVKAKAEQPSNQQTALEIYEPDIEPDTNLLMFRGRKPMYSQAPHYSHIEAAGDQFTAQQKRTIIVDIVCNLDDADLDRLFAFAIEIDDEPIRSRRPRQIDLESKGTLEDLMCLWANNDLDPNDYVAVLSALRDCKDSLRRQNIINEMISYIFRFTQERLQGEAMWRKRFEAKLITEDD